jgi:hypothetical protein
VVFDRLASGFHVGAVRISRAHNLAEDAFAHQLVRYFGIEFIVKPRHQTAHFISTVRIAWQ